MDAETERAITTELGALRIIVMNALMMLDVRGAAPGLLGDLADATAAMPDALEVEIGARARAIEMLRQASAFLSPKH